MNDKPTPGTVPMTGPYVRQKHRMAAGSNENGQSVPGSPGTQPPKTPA